MIVTEERAVEVCKLTPTAALDLLDKGKAGDAQALAEWGIYACYRQLRRLGASESAALHHTREIARGVEIQVAIKS